MKALIVLAVTSASALVVLAGILLLQGGFFRAPRFISNFEQEVLSRGRPFIEPLTVRDGLAMYSVGQGKPILVVPYPHADTVMPMAQDSLSRVLLSLGRRVISFDVPGAYRSTRKPKGTMGEMIQCALETLDAFGVTGKVDVMGHSMGSLCALGLAIEHPERVERLILVGSMSGFPAAIRWGMPGSVWRVTDIEYWQCAWWGIRLRFGRGDLALHKRLSNLMLAPCFYDKSFFTEAEIDPDDRAKGAPIRCLWLANLGWKLDYAPRLGRLRLPTLICVGRHDPETPIPCSEQLAWGIPQSQLVVFERSGHMPFIEEQEQFTRAVGGFLAD